MQVEHATMLQLMRKAINDSKKLCSEWYATKHTEGECGMRKRVYVNQGGKLQVDETATRLINLTTGVHQRITNDVPSLARGLVWCRNCGSEAKVDAAKCLATGWPKCCGATMTTDSPEEQNETL